MHISKLFLLPGLALPCRMATFPCGAQGRWGPSKELPSSASSWPPPSLRGAVLCQASLCIGNYLSPVEVNPGVTHRQQFVFAKSAGREGGSLPCTAEQASCGETEKESFCVPTLPHLGCSFTFLKSYFNVDFSELLETLLTTCTKPCVLSGDCEQSLNC